MAGLVALVLGILAVKVILLTVAFLTMVADGTLAALLRERKAAKLERRPPDYSHIK